MKKIKTILTSSLLSSLLIASPFIVTSCAGKKNEVKYNLTLVSDNNEIFKFSNDEKMSEGKMFVTEIIQNQTIGSKLISNIHLWSPLTGWLEPDKDYVLTFSASRESAKLVVINPVSDLFVILSSNESDIIRPVWNKSVDYFINDQESREILLKYNDIDLPDANSISCSIFKVTSDRSEITPLFFTAQNCRFDSGYDIIHFPLKTNVDLWKNIPDKTQCIITFQIDYEILGIPFTRFVDVNLIAHTCEYKPITFVSGAINSANPHKATLTFKWFDESDWLPMFGKVFGTTIKSADLPDITWDDSGREFVIDEGNKQFTVSIFSATGFDTKKTKINIDFEFFLTMYEIESFGCENLEIGGN